MAIQSERITFPGAHGVALAARLDRPTGTPAAFALFAHCFTCSKDVFAAARISTALAEQGIAVLRFDFTGLGSSEGDFANTNLSGNVGDLVAAAGWLRAEHQAPALLVGHSLGGAAVLAAAGDIPETTAVCSINAPADPEHVTHLMQSSLEEIQASGEATVRIAGRDFCIRQEFLDDLEGQRMHERIHNLRKALLVMHGPRDETVGIENAGHIFDAALHPKSFISLDGADHLLTRREDAEYAATVLAAWASRYVAQPAADGARPPKAGPGEVVVAETREGRYTNAIAAGSHVLRADEPESVGGLDSGFSPYELVSAGLGACTSMTLRMYAERKKWPLDKVTVRLTHGKIHAADCAECETREGKVNRFTRQITIEGDLDAGQRQRLLEIADKCPVHRTLHSEIQVTTELVE